MLGSFAVWDQNITQSLHIQLITASSQGFVRLSPNINSNSNSGLRKPYCQLPEAQLASGYPSRIVVIGVELGTAQPSLSFPDYDLNFLLKA